ncbi:MAG: response regulator [Lewinella sp.]|nr:response regulator [Lewinella sp.]
MNPIIQAEDGYLWTASIMGMTRFDGRNFKTYYLPDTLRLIGLVTAMIEKEAGVFWLGTTAGQLFRFSLAEERYEQITDLPTLGWITDIHFDAQQQLWVGGGNGWYKADINSQEPDSPRRNWQKVHGSPVFKILHLNDHSLLGTSQGLFDCKWSDGNAADSVSYQLRLLQPSGDFPASIVALTAMDEERIWVAGFTKTGDQFRSSCGLLDLRTGSYREISYFRDRSIIFNDLLYAGDGSLLIATENTGLFIVDSQEAVPSQHVFGEAIEALNTDILSLFEDASGMLWITTNLYGIYKLNPFQRSIQRYELPAVNPPNEPYPFSFVKDEEGQYWISTQNSGLFRFDPVSGNYRSYLHDPGRPNSLGSNIAGYIHKDRTGTLWFSSSGYLNRYRPQTDDFERWDGPEDICTHIYEDRQGNLWMGSFRRGLYLREKATGRVYHLSDRNRTNRLNAAVVWQIFADEEATIWLVTNRGLFSVDQTGDSIDSWTFHPHPNLSGNIFWVHQDRHGHYWLSMKFRKIGYMTSLSDPLTYYHFIDDEPNKIFEDPSGTLWFSGTQGIYSYDPVTEDLNTFNSERGISFAPVGRFGNMLEDGILLTTASASSFHLIRTGSVADNRIAPQLQLTRMYAMEEPENPFPLSSAGPLKLKYDQNSLAIEYAGLHTQNPDQVTYQYRLNNRDNEWIPLGDQKILRFAQLPPGNYDLQLRAINPDGYANKEPLALRWQILPPWYASTWAYLLYGLVAVTAIFGIYRFQQQRYRMRLQLAYNDQENQRLKEVDELKTRLYTNITHEFRTPLSLILGVAGQVQKAPDRWFHEGLKVIRHNGQLLLGLINQMLDLAKIQSGNLKPHWVQTDIRRILSEVLTAFQIQSEQVGKMHHFRLEADFDRLDVDTDPEIMGQILTNLLANAVKFTPENGTILLQASVPEDGPELHICVRDTGIGIAPKDLVQIFDRFYQVDNSATRRQGGTGIGLALTREWIGLLHGSIRVESVLGEGTSFLLNFPISRQAPVEEEAVVPVFRPEHPLSPETLTAVTKGKEERPQLLVVEDNNDFAWYIKKLLAEDYDIELAVDGKLGLDSAMATIPDLIITDVMMPEMDGFALCKALKEDRRTNHIPIIMLTAKADAISRFTGLGQGADAYLSKPFHEEELLIRIRKLLENRAVLQQKYQQVLPVSLQPEDNMLLENEFLENLRAVILEHLDDETFDVQALSQALQMDRSQLYRKIKALTGKSPVAIIRACKMQYAKKLLENSDQSISEIAYALGYKDPSYFSRVFQQEFGYRPSRGRVE